jgi:hypothetical protein
MNIKFYAPEWGNALPFDTFCRNVKEAGYHGVEMALPFEPKEKDLILEALTKHGLELIGQYWQSFEKDIEEHAVNYEKYLRNLIAAKPVFINCQTGKDYFSFEKNKRLFDLAAALSLESGIRSFMRRIVERAFTQPMLPTITSPAFPTCALRWTFRIGAMSTNRCWPICPKKYRWQSPTPTTCIAG